MLAAHLVLLATKWAVMAAAPLARLAERRAAALADRTHPQPDMAKPGQSAKAAACWDCGVAPMASRQYPIRAGLRLAAIFHAADNSLQGQAAHAADSYPLETAARSVLLAAAARLDAPADAQSRFGGQTWAAARSDAPKGADQPWPRSQ